MQNPNQKSFLLELAEDRKEIIYKDNKTLAKLSWLKSWDKNPRTIEKKDLNKLESQIEELGVYKPLIVYLEKDNATILGGNQRFKILSELRKKYEAKGSDKYSYVWVSVVNAENDVEKIKYALSDNFSAGQYSREKLKDILKVDQGNLFSSYELDFGEKQEIEEFIESMAKPEDVLKKEVLAKNLKNAGIEEDIIEDVLEMSNYGKQVIDCNFNPQKLIGTGAIEFKDRKIFVLKLVFGEEEEEMYNLLLKTSKDALDIFKENEGDLYQNLISIYGRGKGDVLVKTIHLLKNLPNSEEFKEWKNSKIEEDENAAAHDKQIQERDFSGGILL